MRPTTKRNRHPDEGAALKSGSSRCRFSASTSRPDPVADPRLGHEQVIEAALGIDRGRVKPYDALATEYARVLGTTPASLAGASDTFAQAPARWYAEPQGNAVALQTAYKIAFDGCIDYTASAPAYATAPDATSAAKVCGEMERKFWSRVPSPAEIQKCVDAAVTGSKAEPTPRRKWAAACAAVLTSAGFLTY